MIERLNDYADAVERMIRSIYILDYDVSIIEAQPKLSQIT